MPDLLLELFCEEIPARMQAQAAEDLKRLVGEALAERGLFGAGAAAFATPRRLALHVADLPAAQPDTREERKGPKVGAPEAAVAGFLKSAGLASLDEAQVQSDPKKGDFYVATIERKGRPTIEVLADALPPIIQGFPWPKSMRWGAASVRGDSLCWVRPLHSILATFGPETEEPDVVPFAIGDIQAGNFTRGHRFMAPGSFSVRRFDDYVPALERAKVVLDPARRRDIILQDAKTLAQAQGFELIEDESLLHEVAGLVEWPVVLMGEFEEAFLDIPPEVIRATIRANQKCFVLRRPGTSQSPHGEEGRRPVSNHEGSSARDIGTASSFETAAAQPPQDEVPGKHRGEKLANRFILVANIEASDGGAAIVAGNAKVVRARLSDARFFWETDLKVRLDDRLPKLDQIVFHAKLGTQGERVKRLMKLAADLAPRVGADPKEAARAAQLCKADLVSEMVGEFPELQGLMGRYYAAHQGESADVAAACEEHYKPQGPSDRVPSAPVSITVALADKLYVLVGFWFIGETPTGSKDPYALRRAALGVIRIILENKLRLPLVDLFEQAALRIAPTIGAVAARRDSSTFDEVMRLGGKDLVRAIAPIMLARDRVQGIADQASKQIQPAIESLIDFFVDRLKVYLRETKARHDLIDAVFGSHGSDDFTLVVRRVRALGEFLATDEGANLLAGYRRAANILKAEEKKAPTDAPRFAAPFDVAILAEPAERALADRLAKASPEAAAAVRREDLEGAMRVLATLRAPVDTFFEAVTVNAPDAALRMNRLRLLNGFRDAVHEVADFARIGG